MATKRALELGRRLYQAKERVRAAFFKPLLMQQVFTSIESLERAAIAVGIERERGRQAKRKGPRR